MKASITIEKREGRNDYQIHYQDDNQEVEVITTSPISSIRALLSENGIKGTRGPKLGSIRKFKVDTGNTGKDEVPF